MRGIKSALLMIFTVLILGGCSDDDDFAPYTHFAEFISAECTTDEVISLSDILPDAEQIAANYGGDGLALTKATISSEDLGQTGDIVLQYVKADDKKNWVTVVRVYYNIADKLFFSAEFEEGHGKRVDAITTAVSDLYLDMSFQELLNVPDNSIDGIFYGVELTFDRILYCYREPD